MCIVRIDFCISFNLISKKEKVIMFIRMYICVCVFNYLIHFRSMVSSQLDHSCK